MVHLELIKQQALADNIPIMRDDTLDYLVKIINETGYQRVLEIGTATGYATSYLLANTNVTITTLEKDEARYQKALSLLQENPRVTLILGDALEQSISDKYDLIIIDAAKTKNQPLFIKYSPLLNQNGIIITDNIGLSCVANKPLTKNRQNLVTKTNAYIEYLQTHPDFNTTFLEIGDKIAISKRK